MKRLFSLLFCFLLVTAVSAGDTVQKRLYDFVVPDDGSFSDAIAAANARPDQTLRFYVFMRRGEYVVPPSATSTVMGMDSVAYPDPRTDLTASRVSIIGEGMNVTSVRNTCPPNTVNGQWGPACPIEGLRKAYTLRNAGTGNCFQGFTLVNGMADATGRGEALEESGDRTICRDMGLWGYQDTYCSNRDGGLCYFEGGVIRGRTDYVCGKGDIVFNGVEFRHCGKGGYIAAPSRSVRYGYVMLGCTVTAEDNEADGTYALGRPWNDSPVSLWINTVCYSKPRPEGWGEMSGRTPVRMAEYGTRDALGGFVDLGQRRTEWKDKAGNVHSNNPVLSKEEADRLTVGHVLGHDGWHPDELAKDAPLPANVVLDGTRLTWDDSGNVLCWAVCRDDVVWRFTTEPCMEVPDDGNTYSVRAANGTGMLGPAVMAVPRAGSLRARESMGARMAYSEMLRNPDPLMLDFAGCGRDGGAFDPASAKWTYVVSIELEAMLDVYLSTGDRRILDYLASYVERMIDDDGNVVKYRYGDFNLDNIRPAHFLYRFDRLVPRAGNGKALRTFFRQLQYQPRTDDGVYWHKAIYRDQVWLDGIFMGLPFKALAAADMLPAGEVQACYDDILDQIATTYNRTYDASTGLWKHAWDSRCTIFWANRETGLSRHTWARAMGWFTMAMVEVLDVLPHDYARRGELVAMLQDAMAAVVRYQDSESGLWYDVMDVDDPRNYLEATASSMFAYCLLKGARLGWLSPDCRAAGIKAYNGIVKEFVKEYPDATVSLSRCCSVSGLGPESNLKRDGSFDYYMSEPVRDNDGKGIGPFIWASLEMERLAGM